LQLGVRKSQLSAAFNFFQSKSTFSIIFRMYTRGLALAASYTVHIFPPAVHYADEKNKQLSPEQRMQRVPRNFNFFITISAPLSLLSKLGMCVAGTISQQNHQEKRTLSLFSFAA
jgi:hypothetical protein